MVKDIAAAHSKTATQILLRWAVQRGTTAIPKSEKVERLTQNLSVFDFALTEEQMASLEALSCGMRYNNPTRYTESRMGKWVSIYD